MGFADVLNALQDDPHYRTDLAVRRALEDLRHQCNCANPLRRHGAMFGNVEVTEDARAGVWRVQSYVVIAPTPPDEFERCKAALLDLVTGALPGRTVEPLLRGSHAGDTYLVFRAI